MTSQAFVLPPGQQAPALNVVGMQIRVLAANAATQSFGITLQQGQDIDWSQFSAKSLPMRFRQKAGDDNALGFVKFQMSNPQNIYLHDTPDRALFAKPVRHFSNGCVRLEDAQRLGRWFFGKTPTAESDAPEQYVPLPRPVPVYLTYLTAVPTKDGVTFLPDVYGRDGD